MCDFGISAATIGTTAASAASASAAAASAATAASIAGSVAAGAAGAASSALAAGAATGISMSTIATTASLVGTAVSAAASIKAGFDQKKAADYNAGVQRNAAEMALQKGSALASEETDKARRIAGIQRVQMAAGGANISTGSSLDLLSETAGIGQLNALRQINNAEREAYGLNASANLEEYKGGLAMKSGLFNAAGTMLAGGSGAYARFSKFK